MISESDIIALLETRTEPLLARELAGILTKKTGRRIARTDVNKILYGLRARGLASIDDQFRWSKPRKSDTATKPNGRRRLTYYDVLEIAPHAHLDVVQKAYRALAMRYHPDRSSPMDRAQAEEKMKLVNMAYEVLSDPRKRGEYDESLAEP
jgi:DnaJ-domain-containing protein 1